MSATAEAKQPSRRPITVVTRKNLTAHPRQTQPYDSIPSAESSPLLSPPPPYQQFEQGSECNINTRGDDEIRSRDRNSSLLLASSRFHNDVTHICNDGLPNCSSCSITSLTPGILPSPFPSASTPIQTMRHDRVDQANNHRPRRHSSVNHQDPILISKHESDDDSEALDRISDILSHLIKEASDAVNGIDRERSKITAPKTNAANKHTTGAQVKQPETIDTQKYTVSNQKSKLQPHTHHPDQPYFPHRRRSIKSMPPHSHYEPYIEMKEEKSSNNAAKRRSTGSIGKSRWSRGPANKEAIQTNLVAAQRGSPLSSSFKSAPSRSSHSVPNSPKIMRLSRRNRLLNDPLMESYKRIDDSLAMVDSLSRDLAADVDTTDEPSAPKDINRSVASQNSTALARHNPNESLSLVIFLLVQGIHSVLAFLSGMLSLKTSGLHLETLESDTFYNALSWAFTYTMGNVLVDQCIEKVPARPSYRVTIPGEYHSRSPSPPLLNQMSSTLLAKNKQKAFDRNQGTNNSAAGTSHLRLKDVVPCVSQSSSILEKGGNSKSLQSQKGWKDSENTIERLVVQSPTRRFHHPILFNQEYDDNDDDDDEEEILQVVAVKRIRKTGSIRNNGLRILERRNST
ncbi:hypothetical protein K450DRAFT_252084 [Umbelopsis ramanniana AG]|uniref:Uncharacterized protein n=1 Tax=Umbelopsis ramanniana AG TaxID=1314678 RepID=A0AAD5E6R8_UMBRA|nr:uncharacterized protein K450DRAFT_252084 [Umbelopsis ramanniana AG]KAI8577355.1 hypothetical protein K450DRAFT_252084 [Umbelopsis ramanniana AG]